MASASHNAIRRLTDAVAAAADVVAGHSGPDDPLTETEGYRHLLRLLSAGTDLMVERADPLRPMPTEWMSATRKFLGDNPDTIYTTVPVTDARSYELTISGGNAFYKGLVVYGRGQGGVVTIDAACHDTDLTPGADGSYVVHLSAERPAGVANWLQLSGDSFWVMTREYFRDFSDKAGAQVSVRCLDGPDGHEELGDEDLAARIDELATWIALQTRADDYLAGLQLDAPNRRPDPGGRPIDPDLVSVFLPTPDIHYQGCAVALEPGQALRVTGSPPVARYWSVQLMNHWLESLDYTEARVGLNGFQVELEADGSFCVVLAHEDPGHPNWIPLQGHRFALLAMRALLPDGDPPEATYEVVGI